MSSIEALIKAEAIELGFDVVGITSAKPFLKHGRLAVRRLLDGLMGDLPWYNYERVRRGSDPELLFPSVKSIISVAVPYYSGSPSQITNKEIPMGKVARYSWGTDYHLLMKKQLQDFVDNIQAKLGKPIAAKIYVDDGPMQDRVVAERSGVGWFGKNTNILTRKYGSWVFLGQILIDMELKCDKSLAKSCGKCVMCMPACPTGAIVAPYVLDSNKCISFHTIENRGIIPLEIRPLIGDWVFGCDICQDVCPKNVQTGLPKKIIFEVRPDLQKLELIPILDMTEIEFRKRFARTTILRTKLVGLKRNACIALGNIGGETSAAALLKALFQSSHLVRGHAAWGLGRIGGAKCIKGLELRYLVEDDDWVRTEIKLALDACVK